uniref:Uncharacterized protein n=1 Tax=Ditylenchus dipsaci TaxID=166011 RepID=A0A915DP11_9BILA
MISGQCSVTGLTKKLREKYPVYRTYSLAFKDSNGKLVELVANSTTQSAEFWTRAKNEEFYFADLEADRSFSSSPTDTYDDVSDFDQSSPRLAPLDCDVEDAAIGIDLDNWDVPELLAAAILILSEICELRIACITSPNCIVRLGPGANSYEDPMHRYSRKDQVTMHQLAFLKCKNRLSCCGIAFGIHGQASIDHILKAKFPDTAQKNHVFRRLYGRLIEPVDAGVNGRAGDQATSQSNGPSHHSLLSTKEAQTLERMVSNCLPKNGGNDLAKSEAEKSVNFLQLCTSLSATTPNLSKMGREKTPNGQEVPAEPAEIDCIDRGIHTFSQLNLNFDNERLTRLTLSHNKLASVPPNISDLTNLENLNLWNNHIEELPTTISALPNLKILNVGMNRLNKLPRGFGSFAKLEILDLTYNNLKEQSLPGNFFFIPTLRALYLGDNDFESFPEDISHLVNLQVLVLRENDLIDLPKQLATLSKLKELHIQGNRLQVIPPELGVLDLIDTKDPNAKTLRVENNPWIGPLKEALNVGGIESFWNYIKSDNYRRLYQGHPPGIGSPPPKRNKDKKISRVKGSEGSRQAN